MPPAHVAALDVGGFLDRFALGSDDKRGEAAMQLMGFFGWMQMHGLLDSESMKHQVRAIVNAAPGNPAILDYCAHLEPTADEDPRLI